MNEAWQLLRDTGREWYENRAQRLGAALAFYTVFALAPGLVILIPLTGVFLGPQAACPLLPASDMTTTDATIEDRIPRFMTASFRRR